MPKRRRLQLLPHVHSPAPSLMRSQAGNSPGALPPTALLVAKPLRRFWPLLGEAGTGPDPLQELARPLRAARPPPGVVASRAGPALGSGPEEVCLR